MKIVIDNITFSLIAFFILLSNFSIAAGATIIVDASGNGHYTTIQGAIDASTTFDGDTILVKDGTYFESITVNKELSITSEHGWTSTKINAATPNKHAIEVIISNVVIKGFGIYGATESVAAIYISEMADNVHISQNACGYDIDHYNYYGIYAQSSSGHVIISNECSFNTAQGIKLYSSSNCTVVSNICDSNAIGIKLEYSSIENTIANNTLTNKNVNIWISASDKNMILDNKCNSPSIFDGNRCGTGISLTRSHDNFVSGNIFQNNSDGIDLSTSYNNVFEGNTCKQGMRGIYIYGGDRNHFYYNILSNNTDGINVSTGSPEMIFRANTLIENDYGLVGANEYAIYLNNFINSTYLNYTNDDKTGNRASRSKIRYLYNGSYHVGYLGNYYSDHDLTDSNYDGVTDNPYRVLSTYGMNLVVDSFPLSSNLQSYTDINESPLVTITTPKDESTYVQGTGAIRLEAQAYDFEDGNVSDTVIWTSDRDGHVSSPAVLSVGTHALTATAVDSTDFSGKHTINIFVVEGDNLAPVVTINSPPDGSFFSVGDSTVPFLAKAIDKEDGNISSSIQWASDIDGTFTSPAMLSVGTHTISATVTDSGGLSEMDSIQIIVLPVMSISEINVAKKPYWFWKISTVELRVVDNEGKPVPNANITGKWTAADNTNSSACTIVSDKDGWGTAKIAISRNSQALTFCVTDVQKQGWIYEKTLNIETCETTN